MVGETKFITAEIGVLPEGWKLIDIKSIADRNQEHSFIDGDWIEAKYIENNGIRLIQTGNIGIGHFIEKETKKYISEKTFHELNCKEVKPGDILICRLAAPIGRACIAPDLGTKAITAVDVVILKVNQNEYSREYINYYLNFEKTLQRMESFASGSTRQRISRTNLGNVLIAIPPLTEQRKIAAILSSVDEAIEKTEAIIEQTEKVKKGLMQQLLTKGIGHTKFKKTEIGEIPEDWVLSTLGDHLIEHRGGASLTPNDFTDCGVKVIPKKGVTSLGVLRIAEHEQTFVSEEYAQKNINSVVDKNYVIAVLRDLVPSGPNIGLIVRITDNEKYMLAQGVYGLRIKESILPEFLVYLSNSKSFRQQMRRKMVGSTQVHIRNSEYFNTLIPLPGIEEQRRIVDILSVFDKRIESERTKLSTLKIIKQGLMQVLLTGKVRVKVDDEVMSQ